MLFCAFRVGCVENSRREGCCRHHRTCFAACGQCSSVLSELVASKTLDEKVAAGTIELVLQPVDNALLCFQSWLRRKLSTRRLLQAPSNLFCSLWTMLFCAFRVGCVENSRREGCCRHHR